MKRSVTFILLTSCALACFTFSAPGQTGQKALEEAHKRAAKVKEKVVKLSTDPRPKVEVQLFDDKLYTGQITRTDDRSFDVVDEKNQTSTITYDQVKSIRSVKKTGPLTKGIAIGIIGAVAALVIVVFVAVKCEYGC